ncbi:MAG: ABC transporter ATP-binding protein [Spirochaetales bacterium]|nr:ABC transporter ATP-binding protein [Spirochaetales bacterium]
MAEYLEIKSLSKEYSKATGISDISFSCSEGSFTVILGPSGAGKSTTLNIIAGILQETSGEVLLKSEPLGRVPPQKRRMSMVFEDYALYPTFSVFENIASPLRVRSFSENDIKKKVISIASMLGIEEHLDKLPSQVSGGQKQRTALARCLVRDADFYLLDEPIAHLDAKLRHRMRGEFKRIHRELGKTMIYVSHDYREALALADNLLIFNEGRLEQSGNPQEVFSNPKNTFVATLLGEPPMNLINYQSGSVKNACLILKNGSESTELKGVNFADIEFGRVLLGFRHFSVSIHDQVGSNRIPGFVYVWEPIEDTITYTISIGEDLVKVVTTRSEHFELNQNVYLEMDPKALYLFDAETGNRIGTRV